MQYSNEITAVLLMNHEKARFFSWDKVNLVEMDDFIPEKYVLSDFWESKGGLGDKDNKLKEQERKLFSKFVCNALYKHYQEKPFSHLLVLAADKIPSQLSQDLHTDLQKLCEVRELNIVEYSLAQIKEYLQTGEVPKR